MRKISLFILIALLSLTFMACDNQSNNEINNNVQNTSIINTNIREEVVYDDNDIKITAIGANWAEDIGIDVLFKIEDTKNRKLILNDGSSVIVDSFVVSSDYGYADGQLHCITLSQDDLINNGISQINTIQFQGLSIYDSEAEEMIANDISFKITTGADSKINKSINSEELIKTEEYVIKTIDYENADGLIAINNLSEHNLALIISNIKVDNMILPQSTQIISCITIPQSTYVLNPIQILQKTHQVYPCNKLTMDISVYDYTDGKTITTLNDVQIKYD